MRISDCISDVCSSDLWQITRTMSILHRVTGVILSVGAFALAAWLLALAAGGDAYANAAECLASPLGQLFLFGLTLALAYHLFNGIRHLLWDAGWGFQIPAFYASGGRVAALRSEKRRVGKEGVRT